jgi:hypothetical protein
VARRRPQRRQRGRVGAAGGGARREQVRAVVVALEARAQDVERGRGRGGDEGAGSVCFAASVSGRWAAGGGGDARAGEEEGGGAREGGRGRAVQRRGLDFDARRAVYGRGWRPAGGARGGVGARGRRREGHGGCWVVDLGGMGEGARVGRRRGVAGGRGLRERNGGEERREASDEEKRAEGEAERWNRTKRFEDFAKMFCGSFSLANPRLAHGPVGGKGSPNDHERTAAKRATRLKRKTYSKSPMVVNTAPRLWLRSDSGWLCSSRRQTQPGRRDRMDNGTCMDPARPMPATTQPGPKWALDQGAEWGRGERGPIGRQRSKTRPTGRRRRGLATDREATRGVATGAEARGIVADGEAARRIGTGVRPSGTGPVENGGGEGTGGCLPFWDRSRHSKVINQTTVIDQTTSTCIFAVMLMSGYETDRKEQGILSSQYQTVVQYLRKRRKAEHGRSASMVSTGVSIIRCCNTGQRQSIHHECYHGTSICISTAYRSSSSHIKSASLIGSSHIFGERATFHPVYWSPWKAPGTGRGLAANTKRRLRGAVAAKELGLLLVVRSRPSGDGGGAESTESMLVMPQVPPRSPRHGNGGARGSLCDRWRRGGRHGAGVRVVGAAAPRSLG